MTQAIAKQTLYDIDLNHWLETVISQLRSGDLQNVDLENLRCTKQFVCETARCLITVQFCTFVDNPKYSI
jgi:hypothetical protein